MIALRPANVGDTDDLFAWRNDPDTCAASRSTAAIRPDDHASWMKFNVSYGYPEHIVLIADSDVGPVGVVRFDADRGDVMTFDASITMAPKHRGMGFAEEVLSRGCHVMKDYRLNAEIRSWNRASRTIFERCGFDEVESRDGFVQYRREPQP